MVGARIASTITVFCATVVVIYDADEAPFYFVSFTIFMAKLALTSACCRRRHLLKVLPRL